MAIVAAALLSFAAGAAMAQGGAQSGAQDGPRAQLTAPDTVEQGARFKVGYSGPGGAGDRVQIAWPGMAPGASIRSVLATGDRKERELIAPGEVGLYEIRYFSAEDGEILARRGFQVVARSVALDAEARIAQGATFTVTWRGRPGVGDEIRLARPGAPVEAALSRSELTRDQRPVTLEAPVQTGTYEIRYVSVSDKEILLSRPVEVVAASVTIEAPASVPAGTEFEVTWTGPAGREDDIRLARAGSDGKEKLDRAEVWSPDRPLRLSAPTETGSYELRYWSGRGKAVLATRAIRITENAATLDAPREVAAGAPFEVRWTGPGASFDEIEIARPTMADGQHVASARADPGQPATLTAPAAPGRYELRYWSSHEGKVLARRPVAVAGPDLRLSVPATVGAGQSFLVALTPRLPGENELRIARPWAGPGEALSRIAVPQGEASIPMTAPDAPGTYVLRYYAPQSEAILAATAFKVE